MTIRKSIHFYTLFAIVLSMQFRVLGQAVGVVKSTAADSTRTDVFLENLLKQYPQYFDKILIKRDTYNVQFIYTKIDRGANGIAGLKQFYFNVNPKKYFYPVAGVMLPTAVLTFQKLGELKQYSIDKNTTMLTEKAYSGQTAVYNDPTAPDGKPSIVQYLKKMLMTGDVYAYNRLYEFLGQQYLNGELHKRNYTGVQITERLAVQLTEDENRHTNPVTFLAPGNKVLYQQPMQFNTTAFTVKNDLPGKEDFSKGNKMVLEDLHSMLISLVFPNKVTSSQRFLINDEDKKFILKYMSQLAGESNNPPYSDDVMYAGAYNKYLLYGCLRDTVPGSIRVFNVAGEYKGQILDAAYIVDFDKKIEFFLSAIISVDNKNDIKTIGLPFMKNLGQVIYEYETKREKRIEPDLSEVKVEYDGR